MTKKMYVLCIYQKKSVNEVLRGNGLRAPWLVNTLMVMCLTSFASPEVQWHSDGKKPIFFSRLRRTATGEIKVLCNVHTNSCFGVRKVTDLPEFRDSQLGRPRFCLYLINLRAGKIRFWP